MLKFDRTLTIPFKSQSIQIEQVEIGSELYPRSKNDYVELIVNSEAFLDENKRLTEKLYETFLRNKYDQLIPNEFLGKRILDSNTINHEGGKVLNTSASKQLAMLNNSNIAPDMHDIDASSRSSTDQLYDIFPDARNLNKSKMAEGPQSHDFQLMNPYQSNDEGNAIGNNDLYNYTKIGSPQELKNVLKEGINNTPVNKLYDQKNDSNILNTSIDRNQNVSHEKKLNSSLERKLNTSHNTTLGNMSIDNLANEQMVQLYKNQQTQQHPRVLNNNMSNHISNNTSMSVSREWTKVFYPNGPLRYEGETLNGKFDGKGKLYHENGTLRHDGIFKNDGPHGVNNVVLYEENGRVSYEGSMFEGKREGNGKVYYGNGKQMYEGMFKNGGPDGENVTIFFANGVTLYEGRMEKGNRIGYGKCYFKNGQLEYLGQWVDNCPDGEHCTILNKKGEVVYEGLLNKGIYKDSNNNAVFNYGKKDIYNKNQVCI